MAAFGKERSVVEDHRKQSFRQSRHNPPLIFAAEDTISACVSTLE